jgi:triacylglycerol lipase
MVDVHVYLSPGLFGFARLAGFDYLQHLSAALSQRFEDRGRRSLIRVADVHPSSSIRRRSARLTSLVDATLEPGDGPIHLLGHSTGGLDLRLAMSPEASLGQDDGPPLAWVERVRSVTTLNTPHRGTPLASFFATPNGQRLLYAISAITVAGLRLGAPPLAVTSLLLAAMTRTRQQAGFEIELVERINDSLMQVLDGAMQTELRSWLRKIRDDRGAVMQLTPEAMDVFDASVIDRPGLRYQCVATWAPAGRAIDWAVHLRTPWSALSAALFQLIHRTTSDLDRHYPCAPPDGGDTLLRAFLKDLPPPEANDGIVPLRSQLWGTPVWIGKADHLDVVGYFRGGRRHRDWLSSGARFNRKQFDAMMDAIVAGMIEGETAPAPGLARELQ